MIVWWLAFVGAVGATGVLVYVGWQLRLQPWLARYVYALAALSAVIALALMAGAIEASIPRL